jgi:hypothetical protein
MKLTYRGRHKTRIRHVPLKVSTATPNVSTLMISLPHQRSTEWSACAALKLSCQSTTIHEVFFFEKPSQKSPQFTLIQQKSKPFCYSKNFDTQIWYMIGQAPDHGQTTSTCSFLLRNLIVVTNFLRYIWLFILFKIFFIKIIYFNYYFISKYNL